MRQTSPAVRAWVATARLLIVGPDGMASALLIPIGMNIEAHLKKSFWMVGAAVVIACSSLTATAVAHVIAATALAERAAPRARAPAVSAPPSVPPGPFRLVEAGAAFVNRNIFCSACIPDKPSVDPPPASGEPPLTDLPLRLIATHTFPVADRSLAMIRNTASAEQGAYRVGEPIPGAGPVQRILGKYIDFENVASHQIERISIMSPHPPPAPLLPPRPALTTRAPLDGRSARAELLAAIDAGVRKLDDDSYEVDRSLVAKILANPTAAARGARIVPSMRDGRPDGFRMYAIRPSSAYAKLGFKNGDTIHAVNGFELSSMDKALEVYTKVRESNSLSVSISRRGRPMTLDYTIR